MADLVEIRFRHGPLQCPQGLGQAARIALRIDQLVLSGQGGDQQGGRGLGRHVVDGLRSGRRVRVKEDGPGGGIFDRQEIVGTGQAYPAAQVVRVHAVARQQAGVERQHRRIVGARAMAHHEQTGGVAAMAARFHRGPGYGAGGILQDLRVVHLRIQPVVGDHGQVAARGKRVANEGIVGALARRPVAAIKEHHHGYGPRAGLGGIHIEFLPRQGAVGQAPRHLRGTAGRQGIDDAQGRAGGQAGRERDGRQQTEQGGAQDRHAGS